jgi:OHCU decarboxylase
VSKWYVDSFQKKETQPMVAALTPSPHTMDRTAFVRDYGGIYEHSPWIAEAAFDQGLTPSDGAPENLAARMAAIVDAAPHKDQLALLRAHPELVGKLAIAGTLGNDSRIEQAGAGLDKCTAAEFDRFQTLNAQYGAKFEFPFIIAVGGLDRTAILAAFEQRIDNSPEQEFKTALGQVHRIALLRLNRLAT